jgi:hypothetical protein
MSKKGQKNVERDNTLLEFIFWFPKSNTVHYLYMILKLHYCYGSLYGRVLHLSHLRADIDLYRLVY